MTLFVFALNTPVTVTLTDLSRAQGLATDLPPLAAWLGLEGLDTDRIELFPINDLGELTLSQYLTMAHTAEIGSHTARLDALDGSVLLVPDRAVTGTPTPGPEATLIATLPTAKADHSADLEKAVIPLKPTSEPEAKPKPPMGAMPWIAGAGLILAALILWWLT